MVLVSQTLVSFNVSKMPCAALSASWVARPISHHICPSYIGFLLGIESLSSLTVSLLKQSSSINPHICQHLLSPALSQEVMDCRCPPFIQKGMFASVALKLPSPLEWNRLLSDIRKQSDNEVENSPVQTCSSPTLISSLVHTLSGKWPGNGLRTSLCLIRSSLRWLIISIWHFANT